MNKKIFILSILPLLMASCAGNNNNSSASSKDSTSESTSVPSSDSAKTSTSDSSSKEEKITISSYVKSVAETAPVLQTGKYGGEDVDYVITSQPVLFASQQKNSALSVYANVAEEFGKKYSTDGFPQAGLFIKKSLAEDTAKANDIYSFLATVDEDSKDLVNGAANAVSNMASYSSDVTVQASKFGFNRNVLKNVQKTNGLAFITKDKNPDATGFAKFKDPLGIKITASDLSSYYTASLPEGTRASTSLSFSVLTPQGAPSALFTRYASSDNFVTGQPADVQAAFRSGEKDFIVFDSVNGLKLSKKNNNNYLLVRMVTFGNLYLVSTGHDSNNKLDSTDKVVGYGEGLVPDLAFKAVYSA